MKLPIHIRCASVILLLSHISPAPAGETPFESGKFIGRIAYSADGNFNDPDDWAASPVALAILAECGVKDRLVHFDYNCILPQTAKHLRTRPHPACQLVWVVSEVGRSKSRQSAQFKRLSGAA
jgi:hypothetical protein